MPGNQYPTTWPSDSVLGFVSRNGLYTVSPSGGGEPVPYIESDFGLDEFTVSPDGHWAAYWSSEGVPGTSSGAVWVRGFPDPVGRWRISPGTGYSPRWSADGGTLYFWERRGSSFRPYTIFSVQVEAGSSFSTNHPEPLITGPFNNYSWDVHPDGERFLLTSDVTSGIRHLVVLNWFTQLRAAMRQRD